MARCGTHTIGPMEAADSRTSSFSSARGCHPTMYYHCASQTLSYSSLCLSMSARESSCGCVEPGLEKQVHARKWYFKGRRYCEPESSVATAMPGTLLGTESLLPTKAACPVVTYRALGPALHRAWDSAVA